MHFRCENVWNRLADASRQDSDEMKVTRKQEPGDSTSERIKKKMRKPNVLMAVPTIYVRVDTTYASRCIDLPQMQLTSTVSSFSIMTVKDA